MQERKSGWYWVKMNKEGDQWRPDYYKGGKWRAIWSLPEEDPIHFKVGSRIPTPDEPWQCVPSDATEEMTRAMCVSSATDAPTKEPIEFWKRNYRRVLAAAPKPEDV